MTEVKGQRLSSLRHKTAHNFLKAIKASHSKAAAENLSKANKKSITKQVNQSPVHVIINSKGTVSSQSQSNKIRDTDSKKKENPNF